METTHKFHIWIIMLLLWNAGLLVLAVVMIYMATQTPVDAQTIANQCAEAARASLETQTTITE